MRKLTDKQKRILHFIGDDEVTKRKIVTRFQGWHYANASHHIGMILSRMVKSGLIDRVKKGVYKKVSKKGQATTPEANEKQLKLFDV